MEAFLGVDVGAVGVKAALLVRSGRDEPLDRCLGELALQPLGVPAGGPAGSNGQGTGERVFVTPYRRTRGRPLEAVRALLEELLAQIPAAAIAGLAVTGSGSTLVAETLGVRRVNDFQAIARAIGRLHPEIRTVFEMG